MIATTIKHIKSDFSNLKTFVINLDDYKENYIKQLPYLENIGLKIERFKGINATKDEHLNPEYKQYISNFANNFTPKSIIGCGLSHILCCKYIYDNYINIESFCENDSPFFFIMEDDAYPKYNKTEFYQQINKTINEIIILDSMWDIIQLHSDAFFPTKNTYSSHLISGSTAAYLISKNAIIKTMNSKLYSHMDFIEHNFFKFRKYRARKNLFYTDEKNSLNRHKLNKNTFYYYSLLFKDKLLDKINHYFKLLPLRGEKSYANFLEFKIIKLPYLKKDYTVNELIDYLIGFLLIKTTYSNYKKIKNLN